jgi:four helix bundle protein
MSKGVLAEKSLVFAIKVVQFCRLLQEQKKEFVLSKQFMRSGTAIGALIREADYAESKLDFIHKLHIALKEANETEYWLIILKESKLMSIEEFNVMENENKELLKLLISSIKTLKAKYK